MKHKLISAKLFPAPAGLSHTTFYGGSSKSHSDKGWAREQPRVPKDSTHSCKAEPLIRGFFADFSLVSMNCRLLISMFTTLSARVLSLKNRNSECVYTSAVCFPNPET